MKISIAMATYNGAPYLQAQLDSFVSQTRLPDELIITDDRSGDDTLKVIETFAKTAPFDVRWFVNEENKGYAGNFNVAMSQTNGELIFPSDQDDVWFPDKLEVIEAVAQERQDALVIMNDAVLADADLNPTRLTKLGQTRAGGYGDQAFVMGCCMAIRRELFDLCLPVPRESAGHDGWIMKIAEGLGKRVLVEKPLQYYRRHGSNESDFVVNRIHGISMPLVFLDRAKAAVSGRQTQQLIHGLGETRVLAERVAQMRKARPDWLPAEMALFQHALERQLSIRKIRLELRDQPRYARIKPALALWRRGDYSEFQGVLGAMSDILGK